MTTPARHTARRLALHALKAASLVMALATCLPQAAAQWTPGTEYNAVTLGSGSFFTTDDSYTQAVSSNAASVEVWVNFSASAQADMAIGQVFDNLFNEGIVLYAGWNGSTGYDLNMVGVGAFGGDIQTVTNSTTMLPGQWYHIVGEYDANGLACYVDGTATTGNWGGGGGPTANKTFNANTWGSSPLTGLPSFEGLTTGFRIWDGNIGAPTEANSAVNASPTYTGTLDANFQVGTNGDTTALVGSPAGGNLTLTGSTQYAKYGTGTVTVTSDSYFLDTIDAGTLQIGDGNTTGALTTDVVNNGTLSFNRSDALTHSNVISGTGAVSQIGTGTLTLSGTNTYSGATSVANGTLLVTNPSALGTTAAGTSVASGAVLEIDHSLAAIAEEITLNGGTLATSSGGEVIVSGGVVLGSDSFFSPGSATTDELTIQGVVSGSGGFTLNGNAVALTNANNSYTGNTIVASGDLLVTADGALGATSAGTQVNGASVPAGGLVFVNVDYATAEPVTLNGGFLSGAGTSSFAGPITVADFSAIAEGSSSGTLTLSGAIDGSSNLQVGQSNFTGNVVLTANNTYSGQISGEGGTLQFGNGGATGSVASTALVNNAAVAYNHSGNQSAGYDISGTGTLAQNGAGILTLSGTNTYTGATSVNTGTLNIAGSLTSDVVVAAGATVAGSGLSTGALSGAGAVGPGNSPGILAFASVDGSAGMSFDFEFTGADPDYTDATASVNDVLRLTDGTTPFTSALTSSNTVNVYLNVDSHAFGDEYRGGFFTDVQSDFIAQVQDATFNYFLKDAGGAVTYNGVNYRNITGSPWILTTVPATANFAGGSVNGQVLQVVPEPSSFVLAGFAIAGLTAAGYRRRKAAKQAA